MNPTKVSRILIVSAAGVTLVGAGAGAWHVAHAEGPTVGAVTATAPPDTTSAVPLPGAHDGPVPAFSRSTEITNPLFPLSSTPALVDEGEKAGQPYRVTVSLTDQTKSVVVDGITIVAVVAEHRGTLDGELIEVALDYYAQADDGGVWYMGEDGDNYVPGIGVFEERTPDDYVSLAEMPS